MVSASHFIVINCLVFYCGANFTVISKNNALLSRRKRYLMFPMGSNLVMTMSAVKALLQVQPRGWNILFEVDVPFALPSDTRFFKKKKDKEKRSIYSQLHTALTENGLNGTACVREIICDAKKLIPHKGKSLVQDLLLAIFTSSKLDYDEDYGNCDDTNWVECDIPLLNYVLKSFESHENQ